jgi:hypothetical protein
MIIVNVIVTGILEIKTKRVIQEIIEVEALETTSKILHSNLFRERQDLLRRDRIISRAQNDLNMILLKPDVLASGQIIKEITEERVRNRNILYSIIDFITPPINATDIKK